MAETTAEGEKQLDAIARLVADGKLTIVGFTVNGCACGGTFKSDPTPNWMNRWTCGKCGKRVSR